MRPDQLPSKREVFEHWKDRLTDVGILIDWGEPGCWACGFHYDAKYDVKRSKSWEDICRCWERIPLQRCHIVPRSLGGTNTVDNLFLMWRECHDLAANTPIREVFFEWARAQSCWAREWTKIRNALDSFDMDIADAEELNELIGSQAFKLWVSGKIGLHRPQSNYAPRSSRLTPATIVGLAIYYLRNAQSDILK